MDSPGFNIVKSLNITLVGVPSFSFGSGIGFGSSFSLNCFKDRSLFYFKLDRLVVSARMFSSFGYFLVQYFSASILLDFSLVLFVRSDARIYTPVSQSSFVTSMK